MIHKVETHGGVYFIDDMGRFDLNKMLEHCGIDHHISACYENTDEKLTTIYNLSLEIDRCIEDKDIYFLLAKENLVGNQKRNYFQSSKIFKAIAKHIEDANIDDCGLIDKTHALYYTRGHGAIIYKDAQIQTVEAEIEGPRYSIVRIEITVLLREDDFGIRHKTSTSASLWVPIDLVTNFTQEAFDLWAETERVRRHKNDLGQAKDDFDTLISKFPQLLEGRSHVS